MIETTRKGYGGTAEVRAPGLYRLTYITAWNAGRADGTGTHEYLKFKTRAEAEAAAKVARKAADTCNSERSKKYFAALENGNFAPGKWGRNAKSPPPENEGTFYISGQEGYLAEGREG